MPQGASDSESARALPRIEAYVSPISVAQGDTIDVHVSIDAPSFDLRILREGFLTVEYLSIDDVPGFAQATPDSAWEGAGWSPTVSIAIQPDWPSGLYVVELSEPGFWTSFAVFTVREDDPGSTARILFQSAVATWQAYNNWGGKCFYDVLSTDNQRAYTLSFERPYKPSLGRGYIGDELHLARWLESNGFAVEYCTNLDTHADPNLLSHYDLFVDAWHDEYWSKEMRDNVENRIASGGNVAFFGANTCWWQIRFSPGMDQIICYKEAALDPLFGVEDSLVTVLWRDPPVNRPENAMTGVSFAHGGAPQDTGLGYTVHRDDHWVLAGTGLVNGQEFGAADGIIGVELDGALFEWQDGVPVVTGEDGTPLSFAILATAPGDRGYATLGIFQGPGTVFNAASITWTLGLAANPVVQTITNNVFTALLSEPTRVELPPGAIGFKLHPSFPNPARGAAGLRFEVPSRGRVRLSVYDVGGRLVRVLADAELDRGEHRAAWDGRETGGAGVAPGTYFVRLDAGGRTETRKVVFLSHE
jgi:hypothetical protein